MRSPFPSQSDVPVTLCPIIMFQFGTIPLNSVFICLLLVFFNEYGSHKVRKFICTVYICIPIVTEHSFEEMNEF